MKLVVNGEKKDVTDRVSVTDLLAELEVKMPDMVSVNLNGEILERRNFDATRLAEGDQVEFLYYMGGGRGSA